MNIPRICAIFKTPIQANILFLDVKLEFDIKYSSRTLTKLNSSGIIRYSRKWTQGLTFQCCRFNAKDFLERSRNGRIVFAGDSIGRNQWESMICMLAQGVSNQSTIYEEFGNPITKHRGYLSMKFQEYNLTVEYYRVPFLVVVDRPPANASKEVRGVIRLDKLHWYFTKWVNADVIIFNAGHWWNEDKTINMYESQVL